MKRIAELVREHPFFQGLGQEFCDLVAGCAHNVHIPAGAYLLQEGGAADTLYLIRHGRVALETSVPGSPPIRFQTLEEGELVGLSWLVPPYRWSYDARALEDVRAIAMDATCLRRRCDDDHDLGYAVMQRLVPLLLARLQATRWQVMDVYGEPQ